MASSIQRMEERKRLRTTSPTGCDSKNPVEEARSEPRLVKLLSLDCKDGNAGVCIVQPPSASLRVGPARFAQLSLKGVTSWFIWVRMGFGCAAVESSRMGLVPGRSERGNDTN